MTTTFNSPLTMPSPTRPFKGANYQLDTHAIVLSGLGHVVWWHRAYVAIA